MYQMVTKVRGGLWSTILDHCWIATIAFTSSTLGFCWLQKRASYCQFATSEATATGCHQISSATATTAAAAGGELCACRAPISSELMRASLSISSHLSRS